MTANRELSLDRELALEQPMEDVRHEAVLNIVRTANVLSTSGGQLFRRHGLTEAQFNVLFALRYKTQPWTQSDLGRRLVVTRASITSVLDKLEEKQLVKRTRVPGNRRIHHVELTARGRALEDALEQQYRARIHAVLRGMSDAECRRLVHLLEQVRAGLAASESGE
jgi:MarR family 2-MHQ and catechol resistance regulon transcriptional repressor